MVRLNTSFRNAPVVHDAQLLLRRGVAGLGLGQDGGVDLLHVTSVLADARERVREGGRDEHGHGFVRWRALEVWRARDAVWASRLLWSPLESVGLVLLGVRRRAARARDVACH